MTGRFVWHELMVSDTKAAIAFYSEVIGWKTEAFGPPKDGDQYNMWVGGQGPLGGVMTLPAEAKAMGVPSHWMGHVEVADVDESVAQVKSLGGKVLHGPMDIDTVGRFAVIADPQGASLSLFKPTNSMAAHDPTKHGEFSWNELYANDAKAALGFYGKLFGWTTLQEMDMGEKGTYYIYGKGETRYGGVMAKTPDMPFPPSWVYYIHVDDVDSAVDRAKRLGGKTMFDPMQVPDGSRIAQLTDPQGTWFALHAAGKKND